jgi:hypothetical protein
MVVFMSICGVLLIFCGSWAVVKIIRRAIEESIGRGLNL